MKGVRDGVNLQGTTYTFLIMDCDNWGYAYILQGSGVGSYGFYAYGFSPWYNGSGTTGVIMANFIAMDAPKWSSGNYKLYTLEITTTGGGSAVIERWNCASGSTLTYDNLNFGDGWLYKPLDISVDSNDYVYILDTRSDASTVIWAYDNAGTLIGTSDPLSAAQMSGVPKRLDVALLPSPDEIHVLHSNGVTKFYME